MDEVLRGVGARGVARYFKVELCTVHRWARAGCPSLEEGGVGRGHGARYDLAAVQRWLISKRIPIIADQETTDFLKVTEKAMSDCLRTDGLRGQTLPVEQAFLLFYERLYRNLKQTPLQLEDLPEGMKLISANYLDSVERGKLQRR